MMESHTAEAQNAAKTQRTCQGANNVGQEPTFAALRDFAVLR